MAIIELHTVEVLLLIVIILVLISTFYQVLRTRRQMNEVLNATTTYVQIGQDHFITLEQWMTELMNKMNDITTDFPIGFPIVTEKRRVLSSSSTQSYRAPTSPLPDPPTSTLPTPPEGQVIYATPVFPDLSPPYENIDKTKPVQSSDKTDDLMTPNHYTNPLLSKNIQPEPEGDCKLLEACD